MSHATIPYRTPLKLTPKEERHYSISRAIFELADATEKRRKPAGLEFDISQQLERDAIDYSGGLIVPQNVRAGLDSATSTKGGELKFGQDMTWLDMLRIESVAMRMGATLVDGLWGGPVGFPEIASQITPAWQAQNPGSDVAQVDPTFTQRTANPHELAATTAYTPNLLIQSSVNPNNAVDRLVARDIARAHAVLVDTAAIGGTGTSNQPTGVATQLAGAQLIAAGVNGAQPTWINLVDVEAAVATANASNPDTDDAAASAGAVNAWITTPAIRQRLRKTDRAGAATGWMILADELKCKLMSAPFYVSNAVPSTLVKGTSGSVCHALVYGNWSDLYVCQWGPGLELVIDPYTFKKRGLIEITSRQFVDILIARVGSFAGMLDLLQ